MQLELLPGGSAIDVTFARRVEYVKLVRRARMSVVDAQCEAIRHGAHMRQRASSVSLQRGGRARPAPSLPPS